jgi:hypothetical protein
VRIRTLPVLLLAAGCGAAAPPPGGGEPVAAEAPREGLRLRHQIMSRHGDDVQVFEGYMIVAGDALVVRAFAGPGVDLFTVVRRGAEHEEQAHVPGLASRLDLAAVGADIARCYLAGCGGPAPGTGSCTFFGEPLIEERDGEGRIVTRLFPEAHGIGLRVRYSEHREHAGHELAGRIALEWGSGSTSLVILLLEAEVLEAVDPAVFHP